MKLCSHLVGRWDHTLHVTGSSHHLLFLSRRLALFQKGGDPTVEITSQVTGTLASTVRLQSTLESQLMSTTVSISGKAHCRVWIGCDSHPLSVYLKQTPYGSVLGVLNTFSVRFPCSATFGFCPHRYWWFLAPRSWDAVTV